MHSPIVKAQMLIRQPAAAIYQAFVDPAITTRFWFTKSSGKMETGKTVTWEWEMYGAKAEAHVTGLTENEKISFQWGEPETTVDIELKPVEGKGTLVLISNYGFTQTGEDLWNVLVDQTGGFTTVLDALKAYLEHGLELNLVGDKFP